jgi:hypothetical protein
MGFILLRLVSNTNNFGFNCVEISVAAIGVSLFV